MVWADGRSSGSQSTPLPERIGDEEGRWWPCVVVCDPMNLSTILPFYCPVLALCRAKPWTVHVSRVFYIDGVEFLIEGVEPQAVQPGPPPEVWTPGVFIEEVQSEIGDDWRLL